MSKLKFILQGTYMSTVDIHTDFEILNVKMNDRSFIISDKPVYLPEWTDIPDDSLQYYTILHNSSHIASTLL